MRFERRVILPVLAVVAACAGPASETTGVSLLTAAGTPDVLTEAGPLELPPSQSGNRFVYGWKAEKKKRDVRLRTSGRNSRLELVNLEPRRRRLIFEGVTGEGPRSLQVGVSAGGTSLGRFPLAPSLAVDLPADLPTGRVPIDLEVPPGAWIRVEGAVLSDPLPPGRVRIEDRSVIQSGFSAVDFALPVKAGSRLSVVFVPPDSPRPEQSFELWVEGEESPPRRHFQWVPGTISRLRGERSVAVSMEREEGVVRIRMLARGAGPSGRWKNPTLEAPGSPEREAGSPPEVPAPPRLVVLYVLDALRADALGHLGGSVRASPTLDRLAGEGVTITNHIAVAPNTIPSTKALFTGRYVVRQGGWKLAADGPETLAEVFGRSGFRTGLFSGNGGAGAQYGTDRGFEHVDETVIVREPIGPGGYSDNAENVHAAAIEWLDQLGRDESAFAYLHTLHPHTPYTPPSALAARFAPANDSEIDGGARTLHSIQHYRLTPSSADRERLKGLYEASVAYNDRELGRLIEELEERYEPGELLLVITADHGEELFDHGGVLHGYTLYRELLDVPLILWWPEVLSPCRSDARTDALDLHHALRALLGPEAEAATARAGFWPAVSGCFSEDDELPEVRFAAAASVKGGIFMAQSRRHKLIWAPRKGIGWGLGEGLGRSRDSEYFFDLENDPDEQINLAGSGGPREAWLRARLRSWIEVESEREAGGEPPEIDDAELARLRALGYVN